MIVSGGLEGPALPSGTEDPGVGDVGGIRQLAAAFASHANAMSAGYRTLPGVVSQAEASWKGKAQKTFVSVINGAEPLIKHTKQGFQDVSDALSTYAKTVEEIQTQMASYRAAVTTWGQDYASANATVQSLTTRLLDQEEAKEESATLTRKRLSDAEKTLTGVTGQLTTLANQLSALMAQRRVADATLQAVLGQYQKASSLGTPLGGAVSGMSDSQVIAMMGGLTASDVTALAGDSGLARRLAALNDPGEVAAWWKALAGNQAEEAALISAFPAALGRMGGVPAWAMTQANKTVLDRQIAYQEQQVGLLKAEEGWFSQAPELYQNVEGRLRSVQSQLTGLENIKQALSSGDYQQLLFLNVWAQPPTAALVRGDIDTAEYVSFFVPGMATSTESGDGTYQSNALHQFAGASQALSGEEYRLSGAPEGDFAEVAWFGYHPPENDLSAARAVTGAPLDLTLIGHSYGTGVVAEALTKTSANHAVLAGSVGINSSAVPRASAMKVPSGQVFAMQASKDGWAPVGQVNPVRTNPTAPSFGAQVLSADSSPGLKAVGEHGPFGSTSDPSYFDPGTTSMRNIAAAATGQDSQLIYGGTPVDRSKADGGF